MYYKELLKNTITLFVILFLWGCGSSAEYTTAKMAIQDEEWEKAEEFLFKALGKWVLHSSSLPSFQKLNFSTLADMLAICLSISGVIKWLPLLFETSKIVGLPKSMCK